MSASIGQGYVTTTPLQMAVVAATIANGGTVYRPHYVKRVARAGRLALRARYQPEPLQRPADLLAGDGQPRCGPPCATS